MTNIAKRTRLDYENSRVFRKPSFSHRKPNEDLVREKAGPTNGPGRGSQSGAGHWGGN